jgi:hypothetical protein
MRPSLQGSLIVPYDRDLDHPRNTRMLAAMR